MVSNKFSETVIAHRGGAKVAPENTLAAFRLSAYQGVAWVEFDVMLAACDTPVVIHDHSINRTTDGQGEVINFSFEELQNFDAGSWFDKEYLTEKIPSLSQVCDELIKHNLCANVEIKPLTEIARQTTLKTLDVLAEKYNNNFDSLLISSFEYSCLEQVSKLYPKIKLGLLMDKWDDDWHISAAKINAYTVHVHHSLLNSKRIEEIKSAGYYLLAYTVNDSIQAKNLFSLGVDGVFSDYPNLT